MSFRSQCAALILIAGSWLFGPHLWAEEVYYFKAIQQLKITEGKLPKEFTEEDNHYSSSNLDKFAYARLDGEGEIYLILDRRSGSQSLPNRPYIAVRVPKQRKLTGQLALPDRKQNKLVLVHFTSPVKEGKPFLRASFLRAQKAHYDRLHNANFPGAFWFHHQQLASRRSLGEDVQLSGRQSSGRPRNQTEFQRTFNLLSGGRAVIENLQLDRGLPAGGSGDETVPLTKLKGIDIEEFNWKPYVSDIHPQLDPLAHHIPHDQHALFFPSLSALGLMLREATRATAPAFAAASQTESALADDWYPRQLCLPLQAEEGKLGRLVTGVAVTGGDPYFGIGTDVAVLLETEQPGKLLGVLRSQMLLANKQFPEARMTTGKMGDLQYHSIRSPGRELCCYATLLKDAILVTNSPAQLRRHGQVQAGKARSLASLPEYRFFRNRYRRSKETALLIISDPTIRRWCSPKWRIGQSRRLQAAAVMSQVQARHFKELVEGKVHPRKVQSAFWVPRAEAFQLTSKGIRSSTYGSITFLTPINELDFTRVTEQEQEFYQRWRNGYQRYWSRYFDPIAIQFRIRPEQVSADVTVMPLIEGTRYRRYLDVFRGSQLKPGEGDPHEGALLQVAASLNIKAPIVRDGLSLLGFSLPRQYSPLGWVGNWVTIYADESPFWDRFAKAEDPIQFLQDNFHHAPVAVHIEVGHSMALTGLLTALRAATVQAAPGMTRWETKSHKERKYVKVSPSALALRGNAHLKDFAIYYSVSGKALVLSLDEKVLQRSLERQEARHTAKVQGNAPPASRRWLGKNLNVYADDSVLHFLRFTRGKEHQQWLRRSAWRAIPILNEWKQLYPDKDPVALHKQYWGVELDGPLGKGYRWNDKWGTMESVTYGHPGQPSKGPTLPEMFREYQSANIGLTFEKEGLRAAVELRRNPAKAVKAASRRSKKSPGSAR